MITHTRKRTGRRDEKGGTFPLYDKPMSRRVLDTTDEQWEFCRNQPGGAAAYIRSLIERERQQSQPQQATTTTEPE